MTESSVPRVRVAVPADVSELARVINAAYRVEDFFINGDRTYAAQILERMQGSHAAFLVIDAPDGQGLIAAAFVDVRGDRGYFGMLSVDPAWQKRGLSVVMLAAIEDYCRVRRCRHLDIEVVNLREELPAFYRARGFTSCGTSPFPDPHKLTRPAHLELMTKPLGPGATAG